MDNLKNFLGEISIDIFLQEYWNKKPLLVRGSCPAASDFATKEDLLDFAMDEDFESRIIYEQGQNYSVKEGPIEKTDLRGKYTVACHALNLFSPEFKSLEEKVTSFIPHWQFDDVMSTLSTVGASVGAHTDHYGVFILQAKGSREWFIQENPNQQFKEDMDVKILKEFNADYSWILNPGDMIYIPPLCAHHGVTLKESISYSVGFKAFETQNILKDYMFDLAQNIEDDSFYKHEARTPKYELNDEFVDFFHTKLLNNLQNKDLFKSWLSSHLSRSRYPLESANEKFDFSTMELANDLRYIHSKTSEDNFEVYLNGHFLMLNREDFLELNSAIDTNSLDHLTSKKLKDFMMKSFAVI